MPDPVRVDTLSRPSLYSRAQLSRAVRIAEALGRGRRVLVEPPRKETP
ncbi:MAG TPA: hypothetical protein VN213_20155 [Solirubrobacteraceae bacterium]|nr:hypothetical protein [Solirubrobacteraceae bacterium]